MSEEQDFLWECVDALAGYTPTDPAPRPKMDCPQCGSYVQGITEEQQHDPSFAASFSRPVMAYQPPRFNLEPCGCRLTIEQERALIEAFERQVARTSRMSRNPIFGQEFPRGR